MSKTPFIFIVDDDDEDRMLIQEAFKEIGITKNIQQFENGSAGLEALKELKEGALPDLVILDFNMPRLNGVEVLQQIMADKQLAQIPTVIFTTSVNAKIKEDCLKLGARGCYIKPTNFKDYIDIIRTFYSYILQGADS